MVAEAAVFFACGEVSDAELGQVVLVTPIDFFEREIFFLHFVDQEVDGSNPFAPTTSFLYVPRVFCFSCKSL